MILPAIISALALAGAPANTTVVCQPTPLPDNDLGLTYWTDEHIELDYHVCGGLIMLSVTPTERLKILKLNPGYDSLRYMGLAALVMLHEASHVALHTTDETMAECHAMALVVEFLSQRLGRSELAQAMAWVEAYDRGLPPTYHSRACT